MMNKVKTKIGTIYFEVKKDPNGTNRVAFFDSNKKLLDDNTVFPKSKSAKNLESHIERFLLSLDSVDELMENLKIESYTTGQDWTDLLEDMYCGLASQLDNGEWIDENGEEISKEDVLFDDFVNVIGDTYLYICE